MSWWTYVSLYDARQAAVTFLEGSANLLNRRADAALGEAAHLYQEEVALLKSAFAEKNAFLREVPRWNDDMRRREQEILSQAVEIESRAVAELDVALAAAL